MDNQKATDLFNKIIKKSFEECPEFCKGLGKL